TTRVPRDMHGLVTSDGKIKYRQVFKQGFRGVALEEWDDDLHFKDEKELVIDDMTDEDRSDGGTGQDLMAEEYTEISKDAHEYL
ncbi:hypothetical protein KC336_g21416, partial [Hortaea werneckii]